MTALMKLGKYVGIPLGILFVCTLLFRMIFVTFVENYEFAYSYSFTTGELHSLNGTGYFVNSPLLRIHTIDLRPTQVSINANSRILNAKLVEFDTTGWRTFVAWHGRNDYSNDATGSLTGNLNQILLSYAYDGSGKSYPFLRVIRELKPDDQAVLDSIPKPNNDSIQKIDTAH